MPNEVKLKNLKCVEWHLKPYGVNNSHGSNRFSFQGRTCYFQYDKKWPNKYSSYAEDLCCTLSFRSVGILETPVIATVCCAGVFEKFCDNISTQTSGRIRGERNDIWTHKFSYPHNEMLKFEIIFHQDFTTDDRSVQTPSYIDNCYLLEGISRDFSTFLNESPNHDVEFTCGDQTLRAHKNVLSCRSDVFSTMFQTEMVEGQSGRVNIQDMDATLFLQFIHCLYTGVLPQLTVDSAVRFYEAGDKYNINTLKKQCADFLIDNLSLDNAYDILIFAERHSDRDLKKSVVEYFIKEKIPGNKGEKWTCFCKENSELAIEVLNLFCQPMDDK